MSFRLAPRCEHRSVGYRRQPLRCLMKALVVVGLGLLWRAKLVAMPEWLSNNGGDALWALMVFFGFGIFLPRASRSLLAKISLGFAWGIELSQLYQAPWIQALRVTFPGKYILGNTFCWSDLVAYALGIGVGVALERMGGSWEKLRG